MTAPDTRMLRMAGAALLLAGGAIHVMLAFDGYGTRTLEDMFLLNGAGSALVALALLLGRGPLPALGGLGIAAGSLLALVLSRVGDGVAGFRGSGLGPMPEAPLTIVFELAAVAVLGLLAVREREPLVDLVRSARSETTS